MKNVSLKKQMETAQTCLILLLIAMFIGLTVFGERVQGTATVVNYAGVVRGGTQLLVKEDLYGNTDMGFQENLDEIMNGLMNGGGKYDLLKISDADYQGKLSELSEIWGELKTALDVYRADASNLDEVYEISQQHFVIADEAVRLAENYSERNMAITSIIDKVIIGICVLLLISVVVQLVDQKKQKAES